MPKIIDTYFQLNKLLRSKRGFILLPNTSHDEYRSIANDSYAKLTYKTNDGMPLVILRRLFGHESERLYGPDVLAHVVGTYQNKRHLFLGNKKNAQKIISKFSLTNAIAINLGFSKDGQSLVSKKLIKDIKTLAPDYIWVGIGSPKQVEFSVELARFVSEAKIFCVGAAFDFLSENKKQAPTLLRKSGFEWLFRLLQEPKRLFWRYIFQSPIGLLYYFICQLLSKKWISKFAVLLLILAIFIPRVVASSMYDPMEDELLALSNNIQYPLWQQFTAPDFTHPWLWYVLMEIPTQLLKTDLGIFPYRLVQIVLFTIFLVAGYFFVRKEKVFAAIFFILLVTNANITHITFQHRMYGLVLGISVLYSLYWNKILQVNKPQVLDFIKVSLLAITGVFTNYSFIWILPIWPLAYFIRRPKKNTLKNVGLFSGIFILGTSWFLPIFAKNSLDSVANNQWAPDFTFLNTIHIFGNYLGMFNFSNNFVITLVAIVTWILLIVLIGRAVIREKNREILSISVGLILAFFVYLFAAFLTKNSLLYIRVSVPLTICIYILLAKLATQRDSITRLVCGVIITIQLGFSSYYFVQLLSPVNFFINYKKNPIKIVKDLHLTSQDCIIVVPFWNVDLVRFFEKNAQVFSLLQYDEIAILKTIESCGQTFAIVQISIDQTRLDREMALLYSLSLESTPVLRNENQVILYVTAQ